MLCYSLCGQYCLGVCCFYFLEKIIVIMLMWFCRWCFFDLYYFFFIFVIFKFDLFKFWYLFIFEEVIIKV